MRAPSLTVAIPTWERRDTVVETVGLALDAIGDLPIEILVADNASADGTVDALETRFGSACRVVAGASNGGFSANFERLVDHAHAPYLMLLSDEETLAPGATLERLVGWLERTQPDVAVAGPNRGLTGERELRPAEYWDAMNYVSGCLFRMASLRLSRERLMAAPELPRFAVLWELWPMFPIAVDVRVRGGSCRTFPEALYTQRVTLPTGIENDRFGPEGERHAAEGSDRRRARYKTLAARLIQAEAMAELFAFERGTADGPAAVRCARAFDDWLESDLGRRVLNKIGQEHPALAGPIRRSVRREVSMSTTSVRWLRRLADRSGLRRRDG